MDQAGHVELRAEVARHPGLASVATISVAESIDSLGGGGNVDQRIVVRGLGQQPAQLIAHPAEPLWQLGGDRLAAGIVDLEVEHRRLPRFRRSLRWHDKNQHGKHRPDRFHPAARPRGAIARAAVATAGALLLMTALGTAQAQPKDPEWPCIQPLVPSLSPGQIWQGPPIDDVGTAWRDDSEVAELVERVTSRRMSLPDAAAATTRFAEQLTIDRTRRMTLFFAGAFEDINESRSQAIAAIRRYARSQIALVDRMSAQVREVESLEADPSGDAERIADLKEGIEMDRRVFADRRRALRPLCEQPVLLEQRLGVLARAAMAQLD